MLCWQLQIELIHSHIMIFIAEVYVAYGKPEFACYMYLGYVYM